MALLYSPPAAHGHFAYQAAQLAAFAVFGGLLLGQGYRRGYPWRQWLPLVAAAALALMLGCQLIFLPPGQWLGWLRGEAAVAEALAAGPRSVVGGAAACLLAVLALRRALGFRGWAVLDAFAGPLCWALAVQSVGCVLAGCCWGEVSEAGWLRLRYAPGTLPYLAQQARGLLPAGAALARPVVPTQLYHLLLCAGVGGLLLALRRRAAAWPGGSRYLLAMGMLCLGRGLIEFWRDPAGEPLLGAPLAGADFSLLKAQGLLLLEAAALLGGWAWLARRPAAAEVVAPAPAGYPALVGVGLLAATARLGPGLLSLPEILTLQALLLLVLAAEGQALARRLGHGLPRLAGLPLSLLLGGALLLATAQAPAPRRQTPPPDGEDGQTLTFSGGVLGNYHDAREDILEDHDLCGSRKQALALQQRVWAVGGEVAVEKSVGGRTDTWGGGLWLGEQTVAAQPTTSVPYRFLANDTTFRYTLGDIHFYREKHTGQGWFTLGTRLGLHLGNLGFYSYFDNGNARGSAWLMPEGMVSLGNPRLLYAQADAGYGAENALGAYTSRLALGSGLGRATGRQLLAGYAHSAHFPTQNLAFVSARLALPPGTGLGALSLEPYFATDLGRHQLFSLKLHYQLGTK